METSSSASQYLLSPLFLLLAIAACIVGYVIYQTTVHPLAPVPGPFWAKLSRLWIAKHSWDGTDRTISLSEVY